MIGNPQTRRVLSLVLIATGGLLIFLAPEHFWVGTVLLGLGAALEMMTPDSNGYETDSAINQSAR